ncbi:MAG: tetratricopeptide repeat protein [Geminicoccaceae bacterium]
MAARAIRSLAVSVVLAIGLAACAGGNPNVTRSPEPSAPSRDVTSLVRLADGLSSRGELSAAIALYQRAAAQSDDVSELIRLGRALSEFGAAAPASGAFRRALAREPGHPDALLGLGTTYLALGETSKSIQYLTQLVDQGDGTDPVRYAALGAAFDMAGRHEQAVAIFASGLQALPGNLDLKSNLALSFAFQGRHVAAINLMFDVTDALEAGRSHYRNLVLVLALAGQDRDAVTNGLRFLGERETQDVMAQAASVRRLSTGADRARAIGLS